MADKSQFGERSPLRFGQRTQDNGSVCAECEALLTDAVDGILTTEEQVRFDRHVAECKVCGEHLAEVRRGAAWLEVLRTPAPEPPAYLLQQILAATEEIQAAWAQSPRVVLAAKSDAAPFRRRFVALLQASLLGRIFHEPRLAMTAAMAFFSIALTLNLTGVHPQDLRLSALQAGSLQRDFYQTRAHAAQYITGLRMVSELETRVRDLQQDGEDQAPTASPYAPAPRAPSQLAPGPALLGPSLIGPGQPNLNQPSDERLPSEPEAKPATKQSAPNSGTSLREESDQRRLLATDDPAGRSVNFTHQRQEEAQV